MDEYTPCCNAIHTWCHVTIHTWFCCTTIWTTNTPAYLNALPGSTPQLLSPKSVEFSAKGHIGTWLASTTHMIGPNRTAQRAHPTNDLVSSYYTAPMPTTSNAQAAMFQSIHHLAQNFGRCTAPRSHHRRQHRPLGQGRQHAA